MILVDVNLERDLGSCSRLNLITIYIRSIPSPTQFFLSKHKEEEMANHGCINGEMDESRYSSPVPVIGLYIAAASLLCMLLMLCDIVAGFRARKQWLPCKFFTLNSVTLTLFSIAAKLPVDLTTPMPSPRDQLSKLSGTTFICISMCFLMPSLGVHPASESFTNMVALTIFVVTVSVNICMQLSTGVIALFSTEHIIILCSLLLLLLIMWHTYWEITNGKKIYSEENKEIFIEGDGSVFQRLRTSYLYGYSKNPHFLASLSTLINISSSIICTLCCATLIQAAFRSLIHCSGKNSVYGWSMPPILVTQALTVIIGSSAVIFRCFTMAKYLTGSIFIKSADKEVDDAIQRNPVLGITSRLKNYGRIVRYAFLWTMWWLEFVIVVLPIVIYSLFSISDSRPFGVQMIVKGRVSRKWVERKSREDLELWIDRNKSEPSSHLSQLLNSQNYPYQQFDTMEVTDPSLPHQKGVYASSLSILLVVRIAQVSLPENHSTSLVEAFNEAKEVFYYTEKNINPKSSKNDNKLLFAKSLWAGQEFNCLLPEIFNTTTNPQTQSELARGLFIITQLKAVLPADHVRKELRIVIDFINRKTYSTYLELATSVEQLFVDMVRVLLAQLPNAIFKSLSNSTDEEYEEYVKLALKMTCKVESIAEHIQWSFPSGCKFTSLVTTEADAMPPV